MNSSFDPFSSLPSNLSLRLVETWPYIILSAPSLPMVLLVLAGPAATQDIVVGVNVVNAMRASIADQNAVLNQLEMGHVHVVRCGISNDDKGN